VNKVIPGVIDEDEKTTPTTNILFELLGSYLAFPSDWQFLDIAILEL